MSRVPPSTSVDRDAYVEAGLPWFDYYDADGRRRWLSTIKVPLLEPDDIVIDGGNSLYTGAPAGRAYKVSYNRPFTTRA